DVAHLGLQRAESEFAMRHLALLCRHQEDAQPGAADVDDAREVDDEGMWPFFDDAEELLLERLRGGAVDAPGGIENSRGADFDCSEIHINTPECFCAGVETSGGQAIRLVKTR